jgi:hypothetical protein
MTDADSLIISDELKGVIDSDNLHGRDGDGEIPLTIWMDNCIIYTTLLGAKSSSEKLILEFKTKPKLSQSLLINTGINELMIGSSDRENKLIKNCKIKSLSVTADEDMYFCRITINLSK